ncbi:cupin domain-containing protein [Rhodovulum sp. YNF3179]|uniref:cupin domain-containing protein n=1 Tax=Rhodovulum sp. YNF3179 TaxID=3425127 RepID=UPI003D338A24
MTDTQTPTPTPKIVTQDDKRIIPFPLHGLSQLVHGADLAANFSLFDVDFAPSAPGAPPHTHAHEDEVYYILEGEVTFMLGDRVETAPAGSTVILPRGILHATWNESDQPARALTIVSQDSRFEFFFDDVVKRIRARGLTDPMEMGAVVAEAGADYGCIVDMGAMPERAKPFFGMA